MKMSQFKLRRSFLAGIIFLASCVAALAASIIWTLPTNGTFPFVGSERLWYATGPGANADFSADVLHVGFIYQGTCSSGVTSPFRYELCWDTSVTPAVLKAYSGSTWAPIASFDTINGYYIPPVGGGIAVNLASASTTDLGSLAQPSITITGSATITSFGSTALPGQIKFLTFSGAAVLTQNASTLILPGGASITAAAGDVAIAQVLQSGSWRVLAYSPAGGTLSRSKNLSDLPSPATARTNLGLGTVATQNGTALTNVRNAISGTYLAVNGDCGSTISAGGNAFYTVTFGSGYPATCQVLVVNEDQARAKNVALPSGTTMLFPKQSMWVVNDNGTLFGNPPGPWVFGNPTLYIDVNNGNDANDGLVSFLTSSNGPLKTCSAAITRAETLINPLATPVTVQAAGGSYAACGVVSGTNDIIINGNASSISSVLFGDGIGVDSSLKVTIQNLEVASSTSASPIAVSRGGYVKIKNVLFGSSASAVMVFASLGGRAEFIGDATINGNSAAFAQATDAGSFIYFGGFTYTMVGTPAVSGAFVVAANTGQITTGGLSPTFVNSGSVIGKKFVASNNGVISGSGTVWPGSVAGTTSTGGQQN